ncbi:MAG TPA: YqaA family protein [Bacteroidota bacterium]
MKAFFAWPRSLKDWVEGLARKPGAGWALFLIAFTESSFFPIPPDVLLIALALAIPQRAFSYALICSVGSVLGGMLGYLIGMEFYEVVGQRIIGLYGLEEQYLAVKTLYDDNAFLSIAVAGFTPIPYKVFTIAAGAFKVSFETLVLASALSRPARFYLVAALFYFAGPKIKPYIDKYFEAATLVFVVLLIGGFIIIKYLV